MLWCGRDIRLVTPFNVERRDSELHYTYLDTVGRPVVIARKNNLVEQHIVDFEVITSHDVTIYVNFRFRS